MVSVRPLPASDLASRRLEADDLPWATTLLMQAVADHPALRYVCADATGPAARWLLSQLLALTLRYGSAYTNADNTALALWLGSSQTAFRRGMLLSRVPAAWHLGWGSYQRLRRLLRTTSWLRGQQSGGLHHLLLAVVVHPSARGAGAGRRLLHTTLAVRQASRLPCYFSCQVPEQLAFYQRQGFALTGHCAVGEGPAGQLTTWALLRPAPAP